jgi:hypothetical protein
MGLPDFVEKSERNLPAGRNLRVVPNLRDVLGESVEAELDLPIILIETPG